MERCDPNERIFIPSSQINMDELDERDVFYEVYVSGEDGYGYLIEKSAFQKFRDYTYLALATPLAVTADVVIGGVYIVCYAAVRDPGLMTLLIEAAAENL